MSTGIQIAVLRALVGGVVLCSACTCESGPANTVEDGAHQPPLQVWAQACIRSPQTVWSDLGALAGSAGEEAHLPAKVARLVTELTGIPQDDLTEAVDWAGPLKVVLYELGPDQSLQEGIALRARRRSATNIGGNREIETKGGRLYLEATRREVYASYSRRLVDALRGDEEDARDGCVEVESGESADLTVDISPELLGSQPIISWIEGRGAWLETSAREARTDRERPSLGDPEVLARMIARWAGRTRERAEATAPLGISIATSPEELQFEISGRNASNPKAVSPTQADLSPTSRSISKLSTLAFVPPDAYLAWTVQSNPIEGRERAEEIIDGLVRIAGERINETEREELRDALVDFMGSVEGRTTFALRPARAPGPLVVLAVAECRDSAAASVALVRLAQVFDVEDGYLQGALEHLGAHLEITSSQAREEQGGIDFEVEIPKDVSENRGQLIRRLLGSQPTMAWKRQGDLLLIAFGQEAAPELIRLAEVAAGEPTASLTTQPVLTAAIRDFPSPHQQIYGQVPALAELMTRGGPGASGLQPGGFVIATGQVDEAWQLHCRMDHEQTEALFPLILGGRR